MSDNKKAKSSRPSSSRPSSSRPSSSRPSSARQSSSRASSSKPTSSRPSTARKRKEKNKISKDEESFDSDLNKSFQEGTPEQDRGESTRRGKNKIYEYLKREIETREKRKPTKQDVKNQVMFVDKMRNTAVVLGDRDLKSDVRDKKRREKEQGEADEEDDFDYMTFVNQGLYEMRSGSAEVAIEYLDQAVKNDPDDELPYVVRSKCLNKLERPIEAMEDANKALRLNKQNPKAIMAKADALYNMGQFENALVQFERGWRVRQDPEIRAGIVKCRDVIMNTVGTTAKEYDKEIVERVIQQMKDMKLKKEKEGKKKKKKDPDELLLGKMNEDVKFLEGFIKSQKPGRPRSGYQIRANNTATEALDYLEKRKEFWKQTVASK